jgi:hypothetical protein
LRVDESRLQTRNFDHREAIARLGVRRPTIQLQLVRAEVRVDLFGGVHAREEDPCLVARRFLLGCRHVHAHFWDAKEVRAGGDVAADDRKAQRPDGRDDRDLFGACREVHNDGAGVRSELDLEVCWGGGLEWGFDFGFRDLR